MIMAPYIRIIVNITHVCEDMEKLYQRQEVRRRQISRLEFRESFEKKKD